MSRSWTPEDGLRCPKCGGELSCVTDSRPGEIRGFKTVRRRRPCDTCTHKETTYEVTESWVDGIRASIRKEMLAKLIGDL